MAKEVAEEGEGVDTEIWVGDLASARVVGVGPGEQEVAAVGPAEAVVEAAVVVVVVAINPTIRVSSRVDAAAGTPAGEA